MMILVLFLGAAHFGVAFPNPFAPTLDAISNENTPRRISDSFLSAVPAYKGNADGPTSLLGPSTGSLDLVDPSAFSSTPANLFGSTIEQMAFDPNNRDTSNLQQITSTISQGVPDSEDSSSANLQSNLIASSSIFPTTQSDTVVQPDPDLESSQAQIPESNILPFGADNLAELVDPNQSQMVALDDGDTPVPLLKPFTQSVDALQQAVQDVLQWVGSFSTEIPDCDEGTFSFCCWLPAPRKKGNDIQFWHHQQTDTRRECRKCTLQS